MILGLVLGVPLLLWITWRVIRRRRLKAFVAAPLAGIDTGVHHHFRTPGSKFLGPKRGF